MEAENECKGMHTRAVNIGLGTKERASSEGIIKVRRVRQGKGAVGRVTLRKGTTQEKPWGCRKCYRATEDDSLKQNVRNGERVIYLISWGLYVAELERELGIPG